MTYPERYLKEVARLLKKIDLRTIERIADILIDAYREERTIFTIGNGGSAATASHFASDLAKGTIVKNMRKRFRAVALSDNVPQITAWANDKGYAYVFVEQLKNLLRRKDVLIAISGSGNSRNIVRAAEYAKRKGAVTIGITGFEGGQLGEIVDHAVIVPSSNMRQIEDCHLAVEHLITTYLSELIVRHRRTNT